MKIFRLTFGLESPTKSPEECKEIAETIALASFPEGHTLIEAKGRWESARGAITEDNIILEVIGPDEWITEVLYCLLYTSPSPRDGLLSRMPSSA